MDKSSKGKMQDGKAALRYKAKGRCSQVQGYFSFVGISPCKLASSPTAMSQYPQINLFSYLLQSELTNQTLRFSVNPELLNREPMNGYG